MKTITVIGTCLLLGLSMVACGKKASGIIGGADGQTAIYVTSDSASVASNTIQLSQIDLNSLQKITEFKTDPELRGFAGNATAQPDISRLKLILPNDSGTNHLVHGVTLTGFGLVDGKLQTNRGKAHCVSGGMKAEKG